MAFTRSVLITGGTAGMGYHCALNIAQKHPDYLVVVASRSDRNSAADSINKTLKQNNTVYLPLDLMNLASVRSFAENWALKSYPPIQFLLLNAGLQFPYELRYTEDGIESTFACNHVGHALLFHLLFPHLADSARVVVTSSGTHDPAQKSGLPDAVYNTAEELAHPTAETEKNPGRQRYSTSKLVNVLWVYALQRRLEKYPAKNIVVAAFDPGLMPGTGLAREATSIEKWLWLKLLPHMIPFLRLVYNKNIHKPQDSGANLAWIAMTADTKEANGSYYEIRAKIKSSVDSYNKDKQEDLWRWTVKYLAKDEEEAKRFDI